MKDYPQLKEMGIKHPEQIEKYIVISISPYDVLKITYTRKKRSLLPSSRTYKFPRIQRDIPSINSDGKTITVLETNENLNKAISELKILLQDKTQKQDVKKALVEQVAFLEEDIALRLKYIKQLAESL